MSIPGTDTSGALNSTTSIYLMHKGLNGLAMLAKGNGTTPDTTANTYDKGCIMLLYGASAGQPAAFINQGTSASPSWSALVSGAGSLVHTPVAVNATATLTAAQVATGYITSTSAAAVTMTLPTGTLLGAAIGAVQGTTLDLYIDNTAGANTVTVAVAVNGIKSDAANTTAASFGQLTVASGVTGIGRFSLTFSSATAYVFTRTA